MITYDKIRNLARPGVTVADIQDALSDQYGNMPAQRYIVETLQRMGVSLVPPAGTVELGSIQWERVGEYRIKEKL